MRAYKVERPLLPPPPPPRSPGVAPRQGGIPDGPAGVRQGEGGKAKAGGELFRVDLDPTGMYAAACSFDKVRCAVFFRTSRHFLCAVSSSSYVIPLDVHYF